MAPPTALTDTDRFIHRLNLHDGIPGWNEATTMGAELIDFDLERRVLEERLDQAHADYREHVDQLDREGKVHTAGAYVESIEEQLAALGDQPGRYHLANGEIIELDPDTHQAHRTDWWLNDNAVSVTTPHGTRFHHPGIHPDATIDPTAQIDPTARIEADAIIGAKSHIGPYVHVGRGATIDSHCVIQDGAWIGPGSELWSRTWVSHGATIGAHSIVGNRCTIGAGAGVAQGTHLEPFSKLGAGTTTADNKPRNQRGNQIAGAIDQLMRLDHD